VVDEGRGRFSRRDWVGLVIVIALSATVAWIWASSLFPGSESVMAMGYPDAGGGRPVRHEHGAAPPSDVGATRGVDTLTADPERPADLSVTLVARAQSVTLASGRVIEGYTLNGATPGPTITARQGQLVAVRVVNESVPDGLTIHWHGVDVPNAADGVAGVTQDAIAVGGEYTYRFVARDAGTYWYHSHQMSHEQVQGGLLGALVIQPRAPSTSPDDTDVLALVHIYDGRRTVNGRDEVAREPLAPGARARVRVVNTDNGPMSVWVGGGPFRLLAVDGHDVNVPGRLEGSSVLVTAGGRADLEVVAPRDGTARRVELGGSAVLVLGGDQTAPPAATPRPEKVVDLLTYGSPASLGAVGQAPTRRFDYAIGRRPGLLDGRPGLWWTINGHVYPDVPMFVVAEGDVVRMRISNSSGDVHPMHLHGHHAVVLSRNGVAATGSPWWVDSLNVINGETYEIAFLADNPGIWMDHCHNLPHAAQGLVAHLAYEGVTTPYRLGGAAENRPE
jgi:FtsP/CotA-like multicopper oxidase with cupredoxin domain